MSKIKGCLFGAAFGDAIAKDTEFMKLDAIKQKWPGLDFDLPSPIAQVTDDTQMMIALAKALLSAQRYFSDPEEVESIIAYEFTQWSMSPDNNRAPGSTCMNSLRKIIAGQPIGEATDYESKGCGANMRVMPIGLLPLDDADKAGMAQMQAAITHAHPTALAASDLTAKAIQLAQFGVEPSEMLCELLRYVLAQTNVYSEKWLGNTAKVAGYSNGERYIKHGWLQCLTMLGQLEHSLKYFKPSEDVCLYMGEGWIAEEALGCALLAYIAMAHFEPIDVLRRCAASAGDSDSIACIAGSLIGTNRGAEAFPIEWYRRIEYAAELHSLAEQLTNL